MSSWPQLNTRGRAAVDGERMKDLLGRETVEAEGLQWCAG